MGCLAKEEKKKIKTDLQYKLPIMNKKTPLVSIIMNCHNGEKFLEKSLKSIINQTYKNWELIFWDNNSKDNTKRIFKKFVEKRFHYYKSEKLLNLYHAKNLAVKHSKGDYICFLDVDDLWIKKKLEYQVKFLLANKDCEILYSNFFIKDEIKKKTFIKFKEGTLPEGFITKELLKNYNIGILTVMISKKILRNFKFKKIYNIVGDFDFIIRASLKFKIGCIQKPLAYYRVHNHNLSSKRINLHIDELKHWILQNKKITNKNSISFFSIRKLIIKLKAKSYLRLSGV